MARASSAPGAAAAWARGPDDRQRGRRWRAHLAAGGPPPRRGGVGGRLAARGTRYHARPAVWRRRPAGGRLAAPLMRQDGWGLPIVVTEGMGVQHMAPSIHAALRRLAGCVAPCVAAAPRARPMPASSTRSTRRRRQAWRWAPARLTRRPIWGARARSSTCLAACNAPPCTLPLALVALRSGQRLFVPWENLDLLS